MLAYNLPPYLTSSKTYPSLAEEVAEDGDSYLGKVPPDASRRHWQAQIQEANCTYSQPEIEKDKNVVDFE